MHPAKTHPQTLIASDFYQHPYGGLARDVYVTREGFARFWEHSVEYIDMLPVNMKVFDDIQPGTELLGYKIQDRSNRFFSMGEMRWVYNREAKIEYKIVVVSYRPQRMWELIDFSRKEGTCNESTTHSSPPSQPLLRLCAP